MSLVIIENGRMIASSQTPLHGEEIHLESGRVSSYWHAIYLKRVNVIGSWNRLLYRPVENFDEDLGGLIDRTVGTWDDTNLAECHFGNVTLNAGIYKISFVVVTDPFSGKLEILHGDTSLGVYDCYSAVETTEVSGSFTYSPTTRATGNLRVRVNGTNVLSGHYNLVLQRLEIIRTG